MSKVNTFGHTISEDQGHLSVQISNYIKHAPLRRLKRSGSLGLSETISKIIKNLEFRK